MARRSCHTSISGIEAGRVSGHGTAPRSAAQRPPRRAATRRPPPTTATMLLPPSLRLSHRVSGDTGSMGSGFGSANAEPKKTSPLIAGLPEVHFPSFLTAADADRPAHPPREARSLPA